VFVFSSGIAEVNGSQTPLWDGCFSGRVKYFFGTLSKEFQMQDWTTILRQMQSKAQSDAAKAEEEARASAELESKKKEREEQEASKEKKKEEDAVKTRVFGSLNTIDLDYYPPSSSSRTPKRLIIRNQNNASQVTSLMNAIMHSKTERQPGHIITLPVTLDSTRYNLILRQGSPPINTKLGDIYDGFVRKLQSNGSPHENLSSWKRNKVLSDFSQSIFAKTPSKITKGLHVLEYLLDGNPAVRSQKVDCNPSKLMEYENIPGGPQFRHLFETNNYKLCKALETQLKLSKPTMNGDDIVMEIDRFGFDTDANKPPTAKWYALLSRKGMRRTELMDLINKNDMSSYNPDFKKQLNSFLDERRTANQRLGDEHARYRNVLLWQPPLTIQVTVIKNGEMVLRPIDLMLMPSKINNIYFWPLSSGMHLVASFMDRDDSLLLILAFPYKEITQSNALWVVKAVSPNSGLRMSFVGAYVLWKLRENINNYAFLKDTNHLRIFQNSLHSIDSQWFMTYQNGKLQCTKQFKTISVDTTKGDAIYKVDKGNGCDFWKVLDWGPVRLRKVSIETSVYVCITAISHEASRNAILFEIDPQHASMFEKRRGSILAMHNEFENFITHILQALGEPKLERFRTLLHEIESTHKLNDSPKKVATDHHSPIGSSVPNPDANEDEFQDVEEDRTLEDLCKEMQCATGQELQECLQDKYDFVQQTEGIKKYWYPQHMNDPCP